jgi:FixJ family two-component response regulator
VLLLPHLRFDVTLGSRRSLLLLAAVAVGSTAVVAAAYVAMLVTFAVERALCAGQELRSRESQRQELMERLAELSPRQKEVMHLVADGLSNKEIARRLGISPRTVENYRAWVMERMGAANIAALVRMVLVTERDR